jgi:hypothetical protein
MKPVFLLILSLFIIQANAQTFCDDLTMLPSNTTNTSQPGDTVSLPNAYSSITLNGDYNMFYFYVDNSTIVDGISGDCYLNIVPNYDMEKVYVDIYLPNNGNAYDFIPEFVINGDSSNSNSSSQWHTLGEFPMTVGGLDISVDTSLTNISNTTAYTLVLEGDLSNGFIMRSSFDLVVNKICYDSEELGVDDITDLQSSVLFPNPTSGNVTLKASEKHTFKSITVYDLLGHPLQSYSEISDYLDFDINGPKGIYIVSIVFENDYNEVIKVVKQ